MRILRAALAIALAGSFSSSALAWHSQGHMMTAAVAWQKMTPGARCRAALLLNSDPEFRRGLNNSTGVPDDEALFVNAATWPDRIKAAGSGFQKDGDDANAAGPKAANNIGLPTDHWVHGYWHFVDIPVPTASAGPAPTTINAVERVELFANVIANPNPVALKAYDLAWLIHLVGDLHQPLHAADQFGPAFAHGVDAGGNFVVIQAPGYHDLHSFWDGAPGDSKNQALELSISINAATHLPTVAPAAANVTDPAAWAAESNHLALQYVYHSPVALGSAGPFTLTPAYIANARTVGLGQVALGGVRLGMLLNAILTWPTAGCP